MIATSDGDSMDEARPLQDAARLVVELACQPLSWRNFVLFGPDVRSQLFYLLLIHQRIGTSIGAEAAASLHPLYLPPEQLELIVGAMIVSHHRLVSSFSCSLLGSWTFH